jgi:hypothetical protein
MYASLENKDGRPCCTAERDCHAALAEYRPPDEPGGYIAMLDGERIVVPACAVLDLTDNRTGMLVLVSIARHSGGAPAYSAEPVRADSTIYSQPINLLTIVIRRDHLH